MAEAAVRMVAADRTEVEVASTAAVVGFMAVEVDFTVGAAERFAEVADSVAVRPIAAVPAARAHSAGIAEERLVREVSVRADIVARTEREATPPVAGLRMDLDAVSAPVAALPARAVERALAMA